MFDPDEEFAERKVDWLALALAGVVTFGLWAVLSVIGTSIKSLYKSPIPRIPTTADIRKAEENRTSGIGAKIREQMADDYTEGRLYDNLWFRGYEGIGRRTSQ